MDYIKILPRCEAYLMVNYEDDYFRAATCYSEGKTYRDAFGDEEWETALEYV